jgi:hypothetical protein
MKKSERPVAPAPDPVYPNKAEIVVKLIEKFCAAHPAVKVNAVLADALFGTRAFMDGASKPCPKAQVISQLRGNQQVVSGKRNNRWMIILPLIPVRHSAFAYAGARKSWPRSAARDCTYALMVRNGLSLH